MYWPSTTDYTDAFSAPHPRAKKLPTDVIYSTPNKQKIWSLTLVNCPFSFLYLQGCYLCCSALFSHCIRTSNSFFPDEIVGLLLVFCIFLVLTISVDVIYPSCSVKAVLVVSFQPRCCCCYNPAKNINKIMTLNLPGTCSWFTSSLKIATSGYLYGKALSCDHQI